MSTTSRAPFSACQPPISTVALDKNPNSSQFWLEMFKTMSETVSVGMVVADMNVPGCPLAYINEGFKTVTGENAEAVARNCSCGVPNNSHALKERW